MLIFFFLKSTWTRVHREEQKYRGLTAPVTLIIEHTQKIKITPSYSSRDRIKLATSAKEKDSSIKDSLLKDSDPPSITDTTVKLVPSQPSNNNNHQLLSGGSPAAQTSLPPHVSASDRLSDSNNSHSKTSLDSVDSVDRNEPHWMKLKRAAISKDVSDTSSLVLAKENGENGGPEEVPVEAAPKEPKPKPSLFLTRKTKHYR